MVKSNMPHKRSSVAYKRLSEKREVKHSAFATRKAAEAQVLNEAIYDRRKAELICNSNPNRIVTVERVNANGERVVIGCATIGEALNTDDLQKGEVLQDGRREGTFENPHYGLGEPM